MKGRVSPGGLGRRNSFRLSSVSFLPLSSVGHFSPVLGVGVKLDLFARLCQAPSRSFLPGVHCVDSVIALSDVQRCVPLPLPDELFPDVDTDPGPKFGVGVRALHAALRHLQCQRESQRGDQHRLGYLLVSSHSITARCKSATVLRLVGSMILAIDADPSMTDFGRNHLANSCHARKPALPEGCVARASPPRPSWL